MMLFVAQPSIAQLRAQQHVYTVPMQAIQVLAGSAWLLNVFVRACVQMCARSHLDDIQVSTNISYPIYVMELSGPWGPGRVPSRSG